MTFCVGGGPVRNWGGRTSFILKHFRGTSKKKHPVEKEKWHGAGGGDSAGGQGGTLPSGPIQQQVPVDGVVRP